MPKCYAQFDFDDLKQLGLHVGEKAFIHELKYKPIPPSDYLKITLERNLRRKLRSEKAKSEFLISPVLAELEELNLQKFAFYSGYKFNVDLTYVSLIIFSEKKILHLWANLV